MLKTLRKANTAIEVKVDPSKIENLMQKEWLLTNSRASFASQTITAANTSKYHGLLIASVNSPNSRIVALSNMHEQILLKDKTIELSTFQFQDTINPQGFQNLEKFSKETGVTFNYKLPHAKIKKSIYLAPDDDIVTVNYQIKDVTTPFKFIARPLIAMRDFHKVTKCVENFQTQTSKNSVSVIRTTDPQTKLTIASQKAPFISQPQWWYNFLYTKELQRKMEAAEDLYAPGHFLYQVEGPANFTICAQLHHADQNPQIQNCDLNLIRDALELNKKQLQQKFKKAEPVFKKLLIASDQFIIKRSSKGHNFYSIIAGYPWFMDWGRDAFISLTGLLLCTMRFQQAASVLKTFAKAVNQGMIPNRFDDYQDKPHYNSIDASMWFVNSAFEYLKLTGDQRTFTAHLLEPVTEIMTMYQNRTRFDIHADDDGLITGGSKDTQLTWMDAKRDNITFTPRHGKCIEVNALWYNNLKNLAQFCLASNPRTSQYYETLAEKVQTSIRKKFWNPLGYLNDRITPEGTVDDSIRPNQVFAVSLENSPLSIDQQQIVVSTIQEKLLTPFGLRTLDPQHPNYQPKYTGDMFSRDKAYHQGTVWPYLIGPFIQAYLRVNNHSHLARIQAAEFITPLLEHFEKDACLGTVSEVFDAEIPHKPNGAIAQAWSVAELIRACMLIDPDSLK